MTGPDENNLNQISNEVKQLSNKLGLLGDLITQNQRKQSLQDFHSASLKTLNPKAETESDEEKVSTKKADKVEKNSEEFVKGQEATNKYLERLVRAEEERKKSAGEQTSGFLSRSGDFYDKMIGGGGHTLGGTLLKTPERVVRNVKKVGSFFSGSGDRDLKKIEKLRVKHNTDEELFEALKSNRSELMRDPKGNEAEIKKTEARLLDLNTSLLEMKINLAKMTQEAEYGRKVSETKKRFKGKSEEDINLIKKFELKDREKSFGVTSERFPGRAVGKSPMSLEPNAFTQGNENLNRNTVSAQSDRGTPKPILKQSGAGVLSSFGVNILKERVDVSSTPPGNFGDVVGGIYYRLGELLGKKGNESGKEPPPTKPTFGGFGNILGIIKQSLDLFKKSISGLLVGVKSLISAAKKISTGARTALNAGARAIPGIGGVLTKSVGATGLGTTVAAGATSLAAGLAIGEGIDRALKKAGIGKGDATFSQLAMSGFDASKAKMKNKENETRAQLKILYPQKSEEDIDRLVNKRFEKKSALGDVPSLLPASVPAPVLNPLEKNPRPKTQTVLSTPAVNDSETNRKETPTISSPLKLNETIKRSGDLEGESRMMETAFLNALRKHAQMDLQTNEAARARIRAAADIDAVNHL